MLREDLRGEAAFAWPPNNGKEAHVDTPRGPGTTSVSDSEETRKPPMGGILALLFCSY